MSKKLREMYRDSVMIKAIIFDLDDTLVNTTEISQRVVKDVYAKNIDKFNGKTVKEVYDIASKVFEELTKDEEIPTPSAAILVWFGIFEELGVNPPPLKTIVKLRREMTEAFSKNVRSVEGAEAVLDYLRQKKLKVGVLTNGDFMQQAQKIINIGFDKEIDYLAGTDTSVADKPDPKAFNFILDKLDISPSEAIMVGDSLEADVLGAKRVGMRGVLYLSGWRKYTEEEKAKADFVIERLEELIDYLESMRRSRE